MAEPLTVHELLSISRGAMEWASSLPADYPRRAEALEHAAAIGEAAIDIHERRQQMLAAIRGRAPLTLGEPQC